MRPAFRVQLPDASNTDFSDPVDATDFFDELYQGIYRMVDDLNRITNNPNYIVVEGKTLQRTIRENTAWRGVIWAVSGTLSEVRREGRKRGFRICDGTNGTPDLRGSFIRGADAREDAGDTGGAASASVSLGDHVFSITDHAQHDHGVAPASDLLSVSTNEPDAFASPDDHDHGDTGQSKDVGAGNHLAHTVDVTSGGTIQVATVATLTHANGSVDTVPPYYEVIYVIKV